MGPVTPRTAVWMGRKQPIRLEPARVYPGGGWRDSPGLDHDFRNFPVPEPARAGADRLESGFIDDWRAVRLQPQPDVHRRVVPVAGFYCSLWQPGSPRRLPVWIVVMRRLAVREEVGLEAAFGDLYRRYKTRVPRWIGLPRHTRTEAETEAAADRKDV